MEGEVTAALGVLEEAGRILLVANWRTLQGAPLLCWDVPGGGVDPGESLGAACVREFREETGLGVRVVDLAFLVERIGFKTGDPRERSRFYYFHVERLPGASDHGVRPEDPDIVETAFRTADEIRVLCPHGYQKELNSWLDQGRRPRYFHAVNAGGGLF